jgi:hypothetical protein
MGFLERKSPKQVELEKKIETLRTAGMYASADRLEQQLMYMTRGTEEKVKPMSQQELVKQVKQERAMKAR